MKKKVANFFPEIQIPHKKTGNLGFITDCIIEDVHECTAADQNIQNDAVILHRQNSVSDIRSNQTQISGCQFLRGILKKIIAVSGQYIYHLKKIMFMIKQWKISGMFYQAYIISRWNKHIFSGIFIYLFRMDCPFHIFFKFAMTGMTFLEFCNILRSFFHKIIFPVNLLIIFPCVQFPDQIFILCFFSFHI